MTQTLTRKIRTVSVALAATVITSVGLVTVAPSSHASIGQCPSGHLCVWTGTNYTGHIFNRNTNGLVNGVQVYSYMRNRIMSAYNRTPYFVYLYEGVNCNGRVLRVNPYEGTNKIPNLSRAYFNGTSVAAGNAIESVGTAYRIGVSGACYR